LTSNLGIFVVNLSTS